MNILEIRKVKTKKELAQFIRFNTHLYHDCPQAVPFLYSDELFTLSKDKNAAFDFCETDYFLAYHDDKIVGRIAAIINHRANKQWNQKTVRFGWFDFIDDITVSSALLRTVEEWGAQKGMTEIAGPLGFTDMDRESMLIEGYDRISTMYINYNYPYYPQHIEKIGGFKKDNDYLEYHFKVPATIPDKFRKVAEIVEQRYNLHVHKFTQSELQEQGLGRQIFDIINTTYSNLYGYSQLSERQIDQLVSAYIKKADLNLITAIVDSNNNNRMVGFGISFPSFTKALKATGNGKLLPFGWWHLLKVLKWHKTDTVDLLLIGVLPEYRTKGANALIFNDLIPQFQKYGFKWAEAMPQMETNEHVQSQWQYLESEQHRRHRCYRKKI